MTENEFRKLLNIKKTDEKFLKINNKYMCKFKNVDSQNDVNEFVFSHLSKDENCPRISSFAEVEAYSCEIEKHGKTHDAIVTASFDIDTNAFSMTLALKNCKSNDIENLICATEFSIED